VVAGKGFIQQHFADLVHCIHGTIEGMSFNERVRVRGETTLFNCKYSKYGKFCVCLI
jgi:hypothetical protein